MELIPKALIVGVFAAVEPSPSPAVTPEKLNRIWAEVAPRHGYRQLQLAPDGSAAQFLGASPEDGATIQLPLIQVRESITYGSSNAADDAQDILKVIAENLGIGQFFNLGIKHIFHVPVPDNDARGFVMRRVAQKSEEELEGLQRGGSLWSGLKYGVTGADGAQYVVVIEPWLADNRFVYLDLDAQFPGPTTLDMVKQKARDAEQYASGPVKAYLDSAERSL